MSRRRPSPDRQSDETEGAMDKKVCDNVEVTARKSCQLVLCILQAANAVHLINSGVVWSRLRLFRTSHAALL